MADPDEYDEVEDDDEGHTEPEVTIEITGLSLFTHVGVTAAEREVGQRLLLDLRIDVGDVDATVTDRVEDTVDYAEVCDVVNLVAQQRSYKTLERLCAAIADRLIEQYERARGVGQGRQARAAACVRRHRGVGRGVARGRMTAAAARIGYLGLGSNVGDRRAMLERAAAELPSRGVEVLASSSVYETEPVGLVLDQRDFYNACLRVRTSFEPDELLDACKDVERALGREAGGVRHGPRPIDVDVLLLGSLEYSSDRLTLPHPEVLSRRFVLVPLLELDPELMLPDGRRVADALAALAEGQDVRRVGDPLTT